MIIKGKTRTNGGSLADYLLSEGRYKKNKDKNERIEVWEANGLEHGDRLKDILADFEHSAAGTQCEKPLFHVQIRTAEGEHLTRAQFFETVNRLEERLDLAGHERVIVAHTLDGQDHVHVVWNRIDPEQHKAAELHYYKNKCTDLARELEKEFGLRELSADRKRGKLSRDEEQQAIRHGQKPQEIKKTIRACWEQSENGQAFAAALEECGYILARGDRRDFVIVDRQGGQYSAARATGSKAAEVRERLADLDRDRLPGVAEAQDMQHSLAHGMRPSCEQEQWDNALAAAAIEKAKLDERLKEEREREKKEVRHANRMAATLYDRADMVSVQQDAMRHLKDAHRVHDAARENHNLDDLRRSYQEERRELTKAAGGQEREDKKARTEQTEYQQRKAERDALRERFESRPGREGRTRDDEGHERERER